MLPAPATTASRAPPLGQVLFAWRIGANAAVAAPTVPVAESPSLNEMLPPLMTIAAVTPARVHWKLSVAVAVTDAPFFVPVRPVIVAVPAAVPATGGSL